MTSLYTMENEIRGTQRIHMLEVEHVSIRGGQRLLQPCWYWRWELIMWGLEMAVGAIRHGSCHDHWESAGKRRGRCECFVGATLHESPTFRLTETISVAGERVGPCHDPMSRLQRAETRWLPITSIRALSQNRQVILLVVMGCLYRLMRQYRLRVESIRNEQAKITN
jgi:hypothetical protein